MERNVMNTVDHAQRARIVMTRKIDIVDAPRDR